MAGLMKQTSPSLISEFYASIIAFSFFIDFSIFFVVDSLVYRIKHKILEILQRLQTYALQWCQSFECCLLFFDIKLNLIQ